jgi:hypothetical protein
MLKLRSKTVCAVTAFALGLVFAGCSEMLSRDDFAARVKDKSDKEVTKLVGKPAAVDSTKPDEVTWTYNSRTFNVAERNKFDSKAVVVFNKAPADGSLRAVDVKFE